jgi:hypothetical protein
MLSTNQYVIHERSQSILIEQNLTTPMKINSPKGEYSLKQHFFDPSKSSPPNDFMIKLRMRMNKYYTENNDNNFDIK